MLSTYQPGGVWGRCDRCAERKRLRTELFKEWTGLMVCRPCLDDKPPQLSPPNVRAEGVPIKDARPDNQQDNTPNTTTADQL